MRLAQPPSFSFLGYHTQRKMTKNRSSKSSSVKRIGIRQPKPTGAFANTGAVLNLDSKLNLPLGLNRFSRVIMMRSILPGFDNYFHESGY